MNLRSYLKEIETQVEQNQNDQAIAHCLNILKKYPNSVDTLRLLGQAYLEIKKLPESVDCFEKVIAIVPDDFVSQVAFSSIKEEERDLDSAIYHMELAFDSQPSNVIVQEELKRLIGKRDGSAPEKISLSRGALVRMYAKGELFQQAINEINSALSTNPERVDLKILLAEMLVKSNAPVQAVEICNQIIETLPFCLVPNQILYQIYLENGLSENSKSVLERLISINPYYAWVEPLSTSVEDVPDDKIEIERIEYTSAFSTSNFDSWDHSHQKEQSVFLTNENTPSIASEFLNDILIPDVPITPEYSGLDAELSDTNRSPIENSPEDTLPDFMKEAGWQTTTNPEVGPPTDFYESPITEAQKSELPDWLKVKASDEFIVNSSVSNALNEMIKESVDPESLNSPVSVEGNDSTRSNDNQSVNSEVTMADDIPPVNDPNDENSDWMAQFFDEAKNNQNELNSEKDLPDWLNNLGQEEVPVTKPDESLPDWLNTLDADIVEKKEETQEQPIDLDAILSDLASQPQEDASISMDTTEEELSDVPVLDAEDISLRLDGLTQAQTSGPTFETPEAFVPDSSMDQQFTRTENQDNYSSPASESEEDDSQIPDWVKTVLTGPEIPDAPSVEEESPIVNFENLVQEPTISSPEIENAGDDYEGNEGAISAATSEELLGWLKEISPEQGLSDETNEIGEISQSEFESTVFEPVGEALDRLTDMSSDQAPVDFSADLVNELPIEETAPETIIPVQDEEEVLPVSSTSLDEEPIAEFVSSPDSSFGGPADFETETAPSTISSSDELAPESNDNISVESNQLIVLIKNNQYDDAIRQLSLTSLENDNEGILGLIQELKHEREGDFDFMQFLGDVYAKSNRFDEALEAYTLAEELLSQTQE